MQRIFTFVLVFSLVGLGSAGCASSGGGGSSTAGGTGGASGSTTGSSASALQWYTTCGDPVCGAPGSDAGTGLPACTTEKEGDACATDGQQCDPGGDCHVRLRCATSDPKAGPGGCPRSRARFKKDITYLHDAELTSLHDELMSMRLTTWHYKGEAEGAKSHLGFIIDDAPRSASVDATGDQVDLYGFASMVAAAAQVEHRRIEALEKQVRALEEELASLRAARGQPSLKR
jgi:Chaperone of endosialidase